MVIDPSITSVVERQSLLNSMIAPRPIALVSSVDKKGNPNLAPFSFFNLFSYNPPIVVFSPSLRLRDVSMKHTLENIIDVPEAVIHVVEEYMLHQVNLASGEFAKGVNEFGKAGFTAVSAGLVRPPMVKECRIKLECRVVHLLALGHEGGAGNLVVCEIVRIHIDDSLLNDEKKIDPEKMNYVARLGGIQYCRVGAEQIFELNKPKKMAIGIDNLPSSVKTSSVLSGKHLAMLASVDTIPGVHDVPTEKISRINYPKSDCLDASEAFHLEIRDLLDQGHIDHAWKLLLSEKNISKQ